MDFSSSEQRLAMESQTDMMTGILNICRERTIKKSHSSSELSASEKKEFQNCLLKFFETPNHVMSVMQKQQQFWALYW